VIDHIGIRTAELEILSRFYEQALTPLGWRKLVEFSGGAAFGRGAQPVLWISNSGNPPSSIHVAILAESRAAVDAFYNAAIAAGARDNGKPAVRTEYHSSYYAAFVTDPDGNNFEAVCHD
jgi:catechol 2,3-dioxygenase-like lactoylglutathione lyase family enzyme